MDTSFKLKKIKKKNVSENTSGMSLDEKPK